MFIFGYGSLCYPEGINGRGMEKRYTWDDLQVARLFGYTRGWYARIKDFMFYGILPASDKEHLNGVIFEVSKRDLAVLNKSEYEGIVYDLKFVEIEEKEKLGDSRVYSYVAKREFTKDGAIKAPGYEEQILEKIQHWGEDFVKEFIQTTKNWSNPTRSFYTH